MKKLLALALSLALSALGYAAPPTPESVENLLLLVHSEKTLDSLFQSMDGLMKSTISRSLPTQANTSERKKVADAVQDKFFHALKEELSWDRMKPLFVQIYSESFSQEEIDGLTAFYTSPVGQAYIDKLPVILQKTMALAQARVLPMMQRVQEAMKQAANQRAATP